MSKHLTIKKAFSLFVIGLFLSVTIPGTATAATIFFGEDLNPGGTVPAGGNAATAQANFLSSLTAGVSTEDFESFASGTTSPLSLTFTGGLGTINATLSGPGTVVNATGNCCGRFATSGTQIWENSGQFTVSFLNPIAAFGFYGTDIGDFNGQVTTTLAGGGSTTYNVGNTMNGPNGSLLFWGLIDTANTFSSVTFGNTNAGTDWFGFDDLTVGDVAQVIDPIPEPSTKLLFGSGLLGMVLFRRRHGNA